MGIQRLDRVGVVVGNLDAAREFFAELGWYRVRRPSRAGGSTASWGSRTFARTS
jgi:catechol 2,3-dioxygenase-like lactoylglutathione lyase family enzyme